MIYGYLRGDKPHDLDGQQAAIKLVLQLHGNKVGPGNWKTEIGAHNGDAVIRGFLLKAAKPGDVIAVARPSAIHPNPLQMIDIAGQLMAKGVNLLVADQPAGKLDLQVLRSLVEPMAAMQARIDQLQAEIQNKDLEHQQEFSEFQSALEAQISSHLAARGVTLANLLKPAGPIEGTSPVARPTEGRRVREIREQLHLSQTEAGALVDPPMDKSAVSRIETQGSGAARYADLSGALEVEAILKSHQAKLKSKGINPRGAEPDSPEIAHIKAAVAGTVQPGPSIGKAQRLADPQAWANEQLAKSTAT